MMSRRLVHQQLLHVKESPQELSLLCNPAAGGGRLAELEYGNVNVRL